MVLISQAGLSVWDFLRWKHEKQRMFYFSLKLCCGFVLLCAVSLCRHHSDIELTCMLIILNDFQLLFTAGRIP